MSTVDPITRPTTSSTSATDAASYASQPPAIDIASLPEGHRAQVHNLLSLRGEAVAWANVELYAVDSNGMASAAKIVRDVDAALVALSRNPNPTAVDAAQRSQVAVIQALSALDNASPASAAAPAVDASRLDAEGRETLTWISGTRGRLVEHHRQALSDGRPDIARRVGVMIRQLDAAAVVMTTHADAASGKSQAKLLAGEVRQSFDSVAEDWAKAPIRAEVAAATTAAPLRGAAAPSTTRPVDTVETRPTGPIANPDRGTGIEDRLTRLEEENRALRQTNETREAAEAAEASKPGFLRGLIEVLEFVGRWFTPFFNLISALFRVIKILYQLLTGQKVDWVNEGVRLAGDIAGIFFPPAGALVNAGANLWFNESQILGGVNEMFDDVKQENFFRNKGEELWNWMKDTYEDAKATITGETPKPAEGSVDFRPIAATVAT